MDNNDDIIALLSKKKHKAIGEYSILTTLISSEFDNINDFEMPYNLNVEEFKKNFKKIEGTLTYYHESCHCIHYLSTTNCVLHYLSLTQEFNNTLMMLRANNVKLPLNRFYNEIEQKINNEESLDANESSVYSYVLGSLFFSENAKWLCGTLDEDGFFFKGYYKKPLLENIAFSLNFNESFKKIALPMGIASKEYGHYKDDKEYKGLGTLHLCECFAKIVEFEHLAHVNEEICQKFINDWLNDEYALEYNFPVRLFSHMMDCGYIKENRIEKSQYFFAHMRIFIDISLMYSDFLFIDDLDIYKSSANKCAVSSTIQPGITFIKILEAFDKCTPLKDSNNDILRLYDDLCKILNIPSLSEMIKKLIQLISLRLEIDNVKTSAASLYFKNIIRFLEEKLRNPMLFINDLTCPYKFRTIDAMLRGCTTYHTPKGYYGEESSFIILEYLYIFIEEIRRNNPIKCSKDLMSNKLEGKSEKKDVRICFPKEEKYSDCSICPIKGYIEQFETT